MHRHGGNDVTTKNIKQTQIVILVCTISHSRQTKECYGWHFAINKVSIYYNISK